MPKFWKYMHKNFRFFFKLPDWNTSLKIIFWIFSLALLIFLLKLYYTSGHFCFTLLFLFETRTTDKDFYFSYCLFVYFESSWQFNTIETTPYILSYAQLFLNICKRSFKFIFTKSIVNNIYYSIRNYFNSSSVECSTRYIIKKVFSSLFRVFF